MCAAGAAYPASAVSRTNQLLSNVPLPVFRNAPSLAVQALTRYNRSPDVFNQRFHFRVVLRLPNEPHGPETYFNAVEVGVELVKYTQFAYGLASDSLKTSACMIPEHASSA